MKLSDMNVLADHYPRLPRTDHATADPDSQMKLSDMNVLADHYHRLVVGLIQLYVSHRALSVCTHECFTGQAREEVHAPR